MNEKIAQFGRPCPLKKGMPIPDCLNPNGCSDCDYTLDAASRLAQRIEHLSQDAAKLTSKKPFKSPTA